MAQDEVIYVSTTSVLISNKSGLMQLKCPFDVECIMSINIICVYDKKVVWKVFSSPEHKLLYLIDKKLYPYKHFHIIG